MPTAAQLAASLQPAARSAVRHLAYAGLKRCGVRRRGRWTENWNGHVVPNCLHIAVQLRAHAM